MGGKQSLDLALSIVKLYCQFFLLFGRSGRQWHLFELHYVFVEFLFDGSFLAVEGEQVNLFNGLVYLIKQFFCSDLVVPLLFLQSFLSLTDLRSSIDVVV